MKILHYYYSTRNSIVLGYPFYGGNDIAAKVHKEIYKLSTDVFEISEELECEGHIKQFTVLGDKADITELDKHFNIVFADNIALIKADRDRISRMALN